MRVIVFLFIFQALFANKLYFKFCTHNDNEICLIYKGKTNQKLNPPLLQAINGEIEFVKKRSIDDYTIFLYRLEYQDFLDIKPIKLGKIVSKEKTYSFTDREFKTFEDNLFHYYKFHYAPSSIFLKQFKKNVLISLFLIFPLYFLIMIIFKEKKKREFLEKIGVKEKLSSYEEVKNFYRFLITNGLKDEYEKFNKKIGKMYFNQKRIFQKTPIKEEFEEFLKRYLKLEKIGNHLKKVFYIYLFVAIILAIWLIY